MNDIPYEAGTINEDEYYDDIRDMDVEDSVDDEEREKEEEARRINDAPMLTIEKIRDADDKKEAFVLVEDWGGKVKIRAISANQMDIIRGRAGNREDKNYAAKLQKLVMMAGILEPHVDENTYRFMLSKNFANVDMVFSRILELSGLKDDGKNSHDARVKRFPRR